jgi:hypothetical protein
MKKKYLEESGRHLARGSPHAIGPGHPLPRPRVPPQPISAEGVDRGLNHL